MDLDEFLDADTRASNEKSTLSLKAMTVVFASEHPSMPIAAALCLETAHLFIIGVTDDSTHIAYFKQVSDEVRAALVRDRRISFENVAYVRDVLGAAGGYKKCRQLPLTIFSCEAKVSDITFLRKTSEPAGGSLFSLSIWKSSVNIPLPGQPGQAVRHISIDCPPLIGEFVTDAKLEKISRDVKAAGKGIEINGQYLELRLIDYAIFATTSLLEW